MVKIIFFISVPLGHLLSAWIECTKEKDLAGTDEDKVGQKHSICTNDWR